MRTRSNTSLMAFSLPFLVVGTLQLGGCLSGEEELPPPTPGGVYSSANGGATFEQSVDVKDGNGETIGYISPLSIQTLHRSVNNSQRIYAVAGSNVAISQDNGQTWQALQHPLTQVSALTELNNEIILIGGSNTERDGVVMRSLDKGRSWEETLTIPAANPPQRRTLEIIKAPDPPPVVVTTLSLNPSNQTEVYAGVSTGELLLGTSSGKEWNTLLRLRGERVSPLTDRLRAPVRKLVPSPHSPGEFLVVTTSGQLVRSLGDVTPEDLEAQPELEPEKVLFSQREARVMDAVYIDQFPDSILIGTDTGAFISTDRGENWTELALPLSKAVPMDSVVTRVSPTNPSRFLVAVNNVLYRSEDGGRTWSARQFGLPNHLITDLIIDPTNAARVLVSMRPLQT